MRLWEGTRRGRGGVDGKWERGGGGLQRSVCVWGWGVGMMCPFNQGVSVRFWKGTRGGVG